MNPDRIEQLLRETDEHARVRETDAAQLADRVLRASRARTLKHLSASFAALLVISGISAAVLSHVLLSKPAVHGRVPEFVSTRPAPAPDINQELAQIRAEIAIREAAVRSMLAMERRIEISSRLSELSQLPSDDDVTERAASAMVFQADRMMQEGAPSAPAVRAYDQVISYFPKTVSADMARKRLSAINKEG